MHYPLERLLQSEKGSCISLLTFATRCEGNPLHPKKAGPQMFKPFSPSKPFAPSNGGYSVADMGARTVAVRTALVAVRRAADKAAPVVAPVAPAPGPLAAKRAEAARVAKSDRPVFRRGQAAEARKARLAMVSVQTINAL